MTTVFTLCLLCIICAEISTVFRECENRKGRFAFKSAASLFFTAAAYIACFTVHADASYACIFPAFALCAAGDILLAAAPLTDKKRTARILYRIGGSAFASAHIIYFIFFSFVICHGISLPIAAVTAVCFVSFTAILFRRKFITSGKSGRILITAYSVILSLMVSACISLYLHDPSPDIYFDTLVLSGGILFGTSDASILVNDFGTELAAKYKKSLTWIVIINYYLAQILFILALTHRQ